MLAMACNQEFTEPQRNPDEGKVLLDFTVQLPDMTPATKTMADQPDGQFKSLHIAVFDRSGYLSEYLLATPELAVEDGVRYKYTAKISESSEERILHFIGNGPESVRFGTEEEVMASIKSAGKEDLYWYRKVLPVVTGVAPGGGMALFAEGDDELESGQQIDGITRVYLSDIPLIRNFVKVVLVDESDEFALEKYAVVNSLNNGMLAAYDAKTGEFVEYFNYQLSTDPALAEGGVQEITGPKTYAALTGEGYDGNIPSVTSFVPTDEAWAGAVASGVPYFVYERETPVDNPTYIIAYGSYQGEDYYYKIDLRNDNGAYFPLLRNFEYRLTLKTVSRVGYETIEEAANSAGSGDISTALETISLVYISDGIASLEVDYTEKVVTTAAPVQLHFTFLEDVNDDDSYGDPSEVTVTVNQDYGLTGPAIASCVWDNENPGTITVTPTIPGDAPKSQSITIKAVYTRTVEGETVTKTLQRTVRYVVMTERTMTAVCIPNEVPKERGSEFALQITIPGGLSSGMFPLEFTIEAEQLTITPNSELDHMPVESGKSIVPNKNASAFYFIKTFEWEDYDPLAPETSFLCYFETNADVSATDIYVANPYFVTTKAPLGNYDPKYFQNLEFSDESILVGENVPFTFTFDMTALPSQGNVIVTLDGAEPDPNSETEQLTFIDVVEGNARYSYAIPASSSLTDHTLNLITNTNGSEVTVTLDAYQFIQNSATVGRRDVMFTGVSLTNAEVGIGKTSTFKFTYDAAYNGVPVTMTLTGLKPQDGDSRFRYNGDNNGGTYTFTPNTTSRDQTITLETTTFGTGISVMIASPDHGYKASVFTNAYRTFILPHSAHSSDMTNNSGAWVKICETNNENSDPDTYLLRTRMNESGIYYYQNAWNDTFVIEKDITEDTPFYLHYYTTHKTRSTYYVATVTAQTLVEGGAITWVEQ